MKTVDLRSTPVKIGNVFGVAVYSDTQADDGKAVLIDTRCDPLRVVVETLDKTRDAGGSDSSAA